MFSKCLLFALLAVAFAYPNAMNPTWPLQKRTQICEDFCKSKLTSVANQWDFLTNGWTPCFCQAGVTSGEWTNGPCYTQCKNRCLSTNGKCAIPSNKTYFKGACCTTHETDPAVNKMCFKGNNTIPLLMTGDCYVQV